MSLATLNGERVLSCEINRPLEGAWHAVVEVDSATIPSGLVTLAVEGGLTLTGTVIRAGEVHGTTTVRIVGGAGNLSKHLPARAYRGTTVRVVASDTLSSAGERLATAADSAAAGRALATWTRSSGSCSAALSELLRPLGAVWRTLADGSVWIGVPTFPSRSYSFELLDEDPVDRSIVLVSDDPTLDANATIDGRKLTYVRTLIEPSSVRVQAHFA